MTEIYGQTWSETARDGIVTLLTALKTTMTSGYDPTFSHIYERHHDVMSLPALSVDIVGGVDSIYYGKSTGHAVVTYYLPFSIRVHIDYAGGVQDGQKATRLLNSIINKLEANRTIATGYYIDEIDGIQPMREFAESDTVGGELVCRVQIQINHTQE